MRKKTRRKNWVLGLVEWWKKLFYFDIILVNDFKMKRLFQGGKLRVAGKN